MALAVDVAQRLEAALGALMAEQLDVAVQPWSAAPSGTRPSTPGCSREPGRHRRRGRQRAPRAARWAPGRARPLRPARSRTGRSAGCPGRARRPRTAPAGPAQRRSPPRGRVLAREHSTPPAGDRTGRGDEFRRSCRSTDCYPTPGGLVSTTKTRISRIGTVCIPVGDQDKIPTSTSTRWASRSAPCRSEAATAGSRRPRGRGDHDRAGSSSRGRPRPAAWRPGSCSRSATSTRSTPS